MTAIEELNQTFGRIGEGWYFEHLGGETLLYYHTRNGWSKPVVGDSLDDCLELLNTYKGKDPELPPQQQETTETKRVVLRNYFQTHNLHDILARQFPQESAKTIDQCRDMTVNALYQFLKSQNQI